MFSELKWTEMGHLQLVKYKILYPGNDKLRGNKVASILRQDVAQGVKGYNVKVRPNNKIQFYQNSRKTC